MTVFALAMELARSASKPIVIADTQDNPGAGGDSDTTGMLRALVRNRASGATGAIYDPEAASAAHAAGVGATITLDLGGKSGIPGDAPYTENFVVEKLSDGNFVATGPYYRGRDMEMGPSACLRIGDVRVVVASYKAQLADQSMYRYVGIEPTEQKILVNKSSVHFRADFEPIAEKLLICAAPGAMPADTATLPWTKLRAGIRIKPNGAVFAPPALSRSTSKVTGKQPCPPSTASTAMPRNLPPSDAICMPIPEIGFEEVRTSGIVGSSEKLKGWGIEVHRGLGGTGVVGVLKGNGSGGKRIGLRADMDALPMEENTNLKWRSTIPGRFHGCGFTADGQQATPCCSAPHAIWPRPRISTAPCISSSSPPKKASAARAR